MISVYDIVNENGCLGLKSVGELDIGNNYSIEDELIIYILAERFNMQCLTVEKMYVIGFTKNGTCTGIYNISVGIENEVAFNCRSMITFLLLSNSDEFMIVHNHPTKNAVPSNEDRNNLRALKQLAWLINMKLRGSYIISEIEYTHIGLTEDDDLVCTL